MTARFHVGDRVYLPAGCGVNPTRAYVVLDVVFRCAFDGSAGYEYALDDHPNHRWREDMLRQAEAVAWEQPRLL